MYIYIYIYICIYTYFISIYMYLCMLCCVSRLPSPHTPIHKGGGLWPPPQQWGAGALVVDSFMDGFVGGGEAADAAKHAQIYVNRYKMFVYIPPAPVDPKWCRAHNMGARYVLGGQGAVCSGRLLGFSAGGMF